MKLPPLALAALAPLSLALGAPAQQAERAPDVPVRLIAGLAGVAPQSEFEVGVHLAVPPGWHVYWENPGDTGMATSAQLEAPPGFHVVGPLFPGPTRLEDAAGIVSFAHEGDLVLFFRVRAPAELPSGPLHFTAQVRYLVCQEVCFVGSSEAGLELAGGAEATAANAPTLRLLEAQRARLPRPFSELGEEAQVEWLSVPVPQGERERFAFRLELPEAEGMQFFAGRGAPLETLRQAQETSGAWRRLAVELVRRPGADPVPARIRGVLRLERGGQVAYFALDLERPCPATEDR